MMKNDIPLWLTAEEKYNPPNDGDGFIIGSSRKILSVLSRVKRGAEPVGVQRLNPALRLLTMLLLIILTSCAHNFYFVFLMLVLAAVRTAMLNGRQIRTLLAVLVPAEAFALIILLPSAFMGNGHSILSITARIYVSVSLAMGINLTIPFREITAALALFRVPDMLIFTLDTAIKYIYIIGDICSDMLTALKIRSVGRNNDKKGSVSGIIGTTVIRSHELANEAEQAMECRGFNGFYRTADRKKTGVFDIAYIVAVLLIAGVFIYSEVVMK